VDPAMEERHKRKLENKSQSFNQHG
jgi:hypothetical protein